MLKVNRKVEYGLIALKHMWGQPKGKLTSVREICELYQAPFDPLAHVLRILNANGILQSERGVHGGYRLLQDLNSISLAQFIEMIEGQLAWTDCTMDMDECKCDMLDVCNIVAPMHQFNQRLIRFLNSITLSELLALNNDSVKINLQPATSGSAYTP